MTLAQRLIENCLAVATAESLTAGLLSAELTEQPGASGFLLGGITCYQDEVKINELGVDPQLIAERTAVDGEVAIQLAANARAKFSKACSKNVDQVLGVSTTGIAGPDSVGEISVGTVYLGISSVRGSRFVALKLEGNRSQIRAGTVTAALAAIQDEIQAIFG